jgi:hypothetical protein
LRISVNAYATDSNFIGRSDTIHIAETDTIASIPEFDPLNAVPSVTAAGPLLARAGERIALEGSSLDRHGGRIQSWEWDIGGTGGFIRAEPDAPWTFTVPPDALGEIHCILRVTDDDGNPALDTVSIAIDPDPFEGFSPRWGDIHTHSSFSRDFRDPAREQLSAPCVDDTACGISKGPAYLFGNARGRGLGFVVITDHAEDLTAQEWEETISAVQSSEEPGSFIPFLGYEFCDSVGGMESCSNAVFPSASGGKVIADSSLLRQDTRSVAEFVDGEDAMWTLLQRTDPDAIGIVAHPPERTSWEFGPPRRRMIIGAEYSSTGGSPQEPRHCQKSVIEGLRRGVRLQIMGGGNDHHGQPGRAALTAALTRELTREALWEAFQKGRTYATRGERLRMHFDVDGRMMGEDYLATTGDSGRRELRLAARIVSPGTPLQSITFNRIMDAERKSIATVWADSDSLFVVALDTLYAGESALYWVEASLHGQNPEFGSEGWTTPVWVEAAQPSAP